MVEIKYQENENDAVKLPNNIRQVGTPGEKLKIYIEDYVMTYLNQVADQKPFGQRAALLLGQKVRKGKTDIYFISAAIHMNQLEIREDSLQITAEIWSGLYDTMNQYFNDKKILGWFLTRPGQSIGMNGQIEKVQASQFKDKGVLFYAVDPMDREDAFYLYENGRLNRQQGYYIYYERNEAMQNYMIEMRKDSSSTGEGESAGFQSRLVERKNDNQWKKAGYNRSNQKGRRWLPQAAAVLLVVLIATAVRRNLINDDMQASQVVSRAAAGDTTAAQTSSTASEANAQTENLDLVESIMQQAEETAGVNDQNGNVTDIDNQNDNAAAGQKEDNQNQAEQTDSGSLTSEDNGETSDQGTEAAAGTHQSYTVKEGDTLLKISRAYYQNADRVEDIIRMNQIEDPDYIYPGMVLQLP